MMNRGCSRSFSWLCRLMVVFNVVCLSYLAVRYFHETKHGEMAAARQLNLARQALSDADVMGRGGGGAWRRQPDEEDHGHRQDDALFHTAEKKPRSRPRQHLPSSLDDDEVAEGGPPQVRKPPVWKPHVPKKPPMRKHDRRAEATDEPEHDPPAAPPVEQEPQSEPAAPPKRSPKPPSVSLVEHPTGDLGSGKLDEARGTPVPLPVYIVEEHHEVLPYWYLAHHATSKRLGSKLPPLSLVHIDGHSDGAPILPDKRYPFTAKTGSKKHIKYLMTSNDNFVMGSKVAGLVSNGLWVYPKWCAINGTDVDIATMGISKVNGTLQACSCPNYKEDRHRLETAGANTSDTCAIDSRSMENKRVWFHQKFCYFRKGPFLQINAPEDNITSELLSALLTRNLSLPLARPDDSTLRTLYKPVEKPSEHNDYLLDIDEDFFGVQLAGRQLERAKISMTLVDRTKRSLEHLFCPNVTSHEVAADRWFVALLEAVARAKARCSSNDDEGGDCAASTLAAQVAGDEALRKLLHPAACPLLPAVQHRPLTQRVASLLFDLTPDQLRVMQSVGLCLGMSLKTNLNPLDSLVHVGKDAVTKRIMGPEPVVKICLGHNRPNESIVQEFLDTRQGLDARLESMTSILRRLPKPPIAVTICRSSRDGYVPRQQMGYIESGILRALRTAFGHIEVTYDPDLYYGKQGWFSYKAKQLGKNFRWPGQKL